MRPPAHARPRAVLTVTLLAACCHLAGAAHGAAAKLWQQVYGDDARHYELQAAIAVGEADGLLLAVNSHAPADLYRDSAHHLWRVSAAGDLVATDLPEPETIRSIEALTMLENGRLLLLFTDSEGWLRLMTGSPGGRWRHLEGFRLRRSDLGLLNLEPLTGDRVAVYGHERLDAVLYRIQLRPDDSPEPLGVERIVIDKGVNEVLQDVMVDGDRLLAVANFGRFGAFFSGDSSVWLGWIDADGAAHREAEFPGRYGCLARSASGAPILLYDRAQGGTQELWVRHLDPGGEKAEEFPAWRSPAALEKPCLLRASTGYWGAATREDRLWPLMIDARGAITWDGWEPATRRSAKHLYVAAGASLYVAAVVHLADEQRPAARLARKIQVTAFRAGGQR